MAALLQALRATLTFSPDPEITLEANPGSLSRPALEAYRAAGVNRISLGVQSAHPHELRLLERTHNFFDVIQAVKWIRQAGFTNLNLDLIYGLPEQTLASWRVTLQRAVDLNPEHISAYALTLEHGTPFGHWAQRGILPLPDPDQAAEMYEFTQDFLACHGYTQYEISNWARGGTSRQPAPQDSTSPPLASSRPAIMRSSVVFPQPLGPTRQASSPFSSSRLTPSSTWSSGTPRLPGKVLRNPFSCSPDGKWVTSTSGSAPPHGA